VITIFFFVGSIEVLKRQKIQYGRGKFKGDYACFFI